MAQSLREEIQQRKPFRSTYHEAELNIVRTAAVLSDQFAVILKPFGITPPQYNVLRILRGAEPKGLCRNEVRDRMLTRMPDMTRLLDRMEEAGLVKRERDAADRRVVTTQITAAGRRLLKDLDGITERQHVSQLGHLNEKELKLLIDLLTKARNPKG